jgi:hypothetical protein
LKAIEAAPPADHGLVEQGTILKILQNEANRDLLPDVYVITETEKPRAWALSQLGIESQEPELEYCTESVGDETSNFVIVLCKVFYKFTF